MKINIFSVLAIIYLAVLTTLAATDVGEMACTEGPYSISWVLPFQIFGLIGAGILAGYCGGFIAGKEDEE